MDIEKLIEQLKNLEACSYGCHINGEVLGVDCSDFEQVMADAAEEISKISVLQAENKKLRDELEQAKREFDGICKYIDSEGYLRKQFCENGNADLEPCICPSLQEHPGYIDSDDCEGCDYFCNSWRGQKEG